MSAEITAVKDGIVSLTLGGTLSQAALAEVQQAMAHIIRAQGKVRILVLAREFTGWERGGDWDDFSFQAEYDPFIEKMAIVGDRRWEDLALIFAAKDLRRFPIEYFASGEQGKAEAWLKEHP